MAYHPVDVHVGARLRAIREEKGVSQKKLAEQVGISFQQIQKVEVGANRISASRMWDICGALRIAPSDLFDGLDGSDHRKKPREDGRSARQRNDLIKAFGAIDDPRARRAIVTTAKTFAELGA